MARLFFALWPDEAALRSIEELARLLAAESLGRAVPAAKVHMTLAFLGEVADDQRAEALRSASRLRIRSFPLVLDHVGSFRRSGVAWAGASEVPRDLLALREKLDARLRDRGFDLEGRAFAPHVTLARRAGRTIVRRDVDPIAWEVREFTLVRSETGTGRYVIEERWSLGD